MSALRREADILAGLQHVRFVPIGDITRLGSIASSARRARRASRPRTATEKRRLDRAI